MLQQRASKKIYRCKGVANYRNRVNIFTDWATALMPIPLLWNVVSTINVVGVSGGAQTRYANLNINLR